MFFDVWKSFGGDGVSRNPKNMVFGGMYIWVFPKIVVPLNGWFIIGIPIKMDDLGVPLFSETSIYIYIWTRGPMWAEFDTWWVDSWLLFRVFWGDEILPSFVGDCKTTILRIPIKTTGISWKVSGRVVWTWLTSCNLLSKSWPFIRNR